MYTAGLVIAFGPDGPESQAARDRLANSAGLVLAAPMGESQPAVLEVDGPREARDWHDWALSIPGVRAIDVAFVHWDEPCMERTHD